MFRREYQVLNQITLSQSALLHNYQYFLKLNPKAQIAPVLKSNAYGHGLIPIAKLIDQHTISPFICVDSLYEAYELNNHLIKTPVFIMGYTLPQNYQTPKKLPFHLSVSDFDTLASLAKFQPQAKIHIKVDTGMCRLGFNLLEIPRVINKLKKYPSLKLIGLYSHLSQADDPSRDSFTLKQVKIFREAIKIFHQAGIKPKLIHLTATAGASTLNLPECNLVRLGLGLYGLSPFGPHTKIGISQRQTLQPVLALTTHLAQVKTIAPGSQVSYGGTYRAKHHESIGILPLGYNEGLNHGLSNKGAVILKDGTICPIIGRVCMNMTIIKIPRTHTLIPEELVTVISRTVNKVNDIYQLSQTLDTIPYTVLTGLHASIRRKVVV